MSKLLQFKEWHTIPETAEYLTKVLGEPIKDSDIYQLALNKKITLSVLLPEWGTYVKIANKVSSEKIEQFIQEHKDIYHNLQLLMKEFPEGELERLLDQNLMPSSEIEKLYFKFVTYPVNFIDMSFQYKREEKISKIYNIWNIALIGHSDILLKRRYYQSVNEPYEEPFIDRGIHLKSLDNNQYAELYELLTKKDLYVQQQVNTQIEINLEKLPLSLQKELEKEKQQQSYDFVNKTELEMPASELPSGTIIIVRTESINDFIDSLNQSIKQNTLNTREKNNILKLLALVLNSDNSLKNLPLDQPYKVADILIRQAELKGYEIPSKDTIAKIIKESSEFHPN